MLHASLCLSSSAGTDLCWPALMRGVTQTDAEINRRDQRRTVCRLISRGEPCIILGSEILSVSMSTPRYRSEMKNPDTVPCNSALNPWWWWGGDFSIRPQMERMPLQTPKNSVGIIYLLSNASCLSVLKNEMDTFLLDFFQKHVTAEGRDGSGVVNIPVEVHRRDSPCSFTRNFESLSSVIITFRLALNSTFFTAVLFVTTTNRSV